MSRRFISCLLVLCHLPLNFDATVEAWMRCPSRKGLERTLQNQKQRDFSRSMYHVLQSPEIASSDSSTKESCVLDDPKESDRSGRQDRSQDSDVEKALSLHGMPWQSSIDPSYNHEQRLFFMPFWEWQVDFMRNNLKNLRLIPTIDRPRQRDLTYAENSKKKKRMITLCFESDEYRLIRLTYLDAGLATQVFTSLWYPRTNTPVLGIDFLQFNNATKHLTVVDMQPIHSCEEHHDFTYSHVLQSIRDLYPSLQHRMSSRFYDENQFFSQQMLLGRGEDGPDYVWKDLFPAYKDYVKTHLELVQKSLHRYKDKKFDQVLTHHKAYDNYSSVRDPAHGLLKAIFGKDYADAFVYDVLFPLSDGIESGGR